MIEFRYALGHSENHAYQAAGSDGGLALARKLLQVGDCRELAVHAQWNQRDDARGLVGDGESDRCFCDQQGRTNDSRPLS